MAGNGTRAGKGQPAGKAGKKPIVTTVTVTTRPAAKSGSRTPPPPPAHTVGSPSGRRR